MSTRVEHDSLGNVDVPAEALYGAQTERARQNFQISPYRFPREFIAALAMIKGAAAAVNTTLGLLDRTFGAVIVAAAEEVEQGAHDAHFPLDIFQTGSGTSTNMNANEVIATLASRRSGHAVHPNDHVNLSQSSNDVIPTAIHVSAARLLTDQLLPAMDALAAAIETRAGELDGVVKTGRTHLMDAVPLRVGQELSGWSAQCRACQKRLTTARDDLLPLAIGGTAIGTGLNAPPDFGKLVAENLEARSGLAFTSAPNKFASISAQDAIVSASAQVKGAALVILKISNDLRWMNSGPVAGLGELSLPALQPGSSMMPGKVNPVIPEAAAMSCVHVIGNDAAITVAAQSGNFQLNTMLPLLAWSLLGSVGILANAARELASKAIAGFSVRQDRLQELAARNPILATALAPRIGYDASAKIAQESLRSGRTVFDVARESTRLSEEDLRVLLDPRRMTGD